ncbi:cellulose binding domain-containing protein [Streptomyces capitiformicae]|uniref:cellulose binding domain-containing protein n=1 Tax=Streptomyces capitiformicae TaxID=2014920 RepID=UPI0027E5981D|nr:cellulose binding domain-containing protein [Streptomyces capitiformicae]
MARDQGDNTPRTAVESAASPSSGCGVTARNVVSHNATIVPGASVDIGFQATHMGNTAPPSSYTLNATVCAVTGS